MNKSGISLSAAFLCGVLTFGVSHVSHHLTEVEKEKLMRDWNECVSYKRSNNYSASATPEERAAAKAKVEALIRTAHESLGIDLTETETMRQTEVLTDITIITDHCNAKLNIHPVGRWTFGSGP